MENEEQRRRKDYRVEGKVEGKRQRKDYRVEGKVEEKRQIEMR